MNSLQRCTACVLISVVVGILTGCSQIELYDGPPAELVIRNARIVTIDKDNPRAQAVAVTGEIIVGVGSNNYIGTMGVTSIKTILKFWINAGFMLQFAPYTQPFVMIW